MPASPGKGDGPRRRVLLKDVALRVNVSGSTASRALADDPRIGAATRLAVKAAAAELNYVPNAAARSLRARRTRTLGLLLPDLRDPVHGQVASAFEQEARLQGYGVMVVAGERDLGRERLALRIFTISSGLEQTRYCYSRCFRRCIPRASHGRGDWLPS